MQPKPWGGNRLSQLKGIECNEPIGECWELSDLEGRESVVADGPEAGLKLSELIAHHGENLLGKRGMELYGGRFPVLIKLLDSRQWLSVQVHPDDATAKVLETSMNTGKEEMWYIMESAPDAKIIFDFKKGVCREDYQAAEGTDKLLELVDTVEVKPGMRFDVHAGTIHSLGPGCLVAEIQQPSDLTYRVFDYGRGRELHLDKALRSLCFEPQDRKLPFVVEHHKLGENEHTSIVPPEGSFMAVMMLGGSAKLGDREFCAGETLLISANHGTAAMESGIEGADYLTVAV